MILERTFLAVVAASAVAAATTVVVVASAFAVFVLLREPLGEAGAAAVVALITAIIVAAAGLVATLVAKAHRDRHPPEPSLVERVADLVREKPLVSAGAALAAGLMALKNPQMVAALAAAFLAPRPRDTHKR